MPDDGNKNNEEDHAKADDKDSTDVEPDAKRAKVFKEFADKYAVTDEQVRATASNEEIKCLNLEKETQRSVNEGQLREVLNRVGNDHKTLAHNNLKAGGHDKSESLLLEAMLGMFPDNQAALPVGEREALMGPLNGVVGRLLVILGKRESDHKDAKSFLELAFFSRDPAFVDLSQAARLQMACGLMRNRKAIDWTGGSSLTSDELKEAKAAGVKASKAASESTKAKKGAKAPSSSSNGPRQRVGSGGGGGNNPGSAQPPGSCNKCWKMG